MKARPMDILTAIRTLPDQEQVLIIFSLIEGHPTKDEILKDPNFKVWLIGQAHRFDLFQGNILEERKDS